MTDMTLLILRSCGNIFEISTGLSGEEGSAHHSSQASGGRRGSFPGIAVPFSSHSDVLTR
jgi:hypothetical protein